MKLRCHPVAALGLFLAVTACADAQALSGLAGVKVSLETGSGKGEARAELLEKFKLRVVVEGKGEAKPLTLKVELPESGPNAWPAADVEVRDGDDRPVLVQRSGIEWHKLAIPVPEDGTTLLLQAVEPPGGWPKRPTDGDQAIQDEASGMRVRIARWHDGRVAALSLRFDDSHPTHLTKAVPILREYGYRGTFMINPGKDVPGSRRRSDFQAQLAGWEALAKEGDHELANHSANHRGATGDEDMDAEIGEAAEAIWRLTPGKSKLMALNLGGGTRWETTRTLRHYLEKYHQFDVSGSLGMDDSYGGRVEAFRTHLENHLRRGLWCRAHYHYIGEGLSSSEANFRAALDIVRQHQADLWIAGMADIHKYQTERDAAGLTLMNSDAKRVGFQLNCATDPGLYDQPLTIELILPDGWAPEKTRVIDSREMPLPAVPFQAEERPALRFRVPPQDASYTVRETS